MTATRVRYLGKGTLTAVDNVNKKIFPEIEGMDVLDQTKIDKAMLDLDGTETKSNLGANAMLGVSLAAAHAASKRPRHAAVRYRYIGGTNAKVPACAHDEHHQRWLSLRRPHRFPGIHDSPSRRSLLQGRPENGC